MARDLAEVAHQIASFKGEANAYLSDPNYDDLRLRLWMAHAAVEAAAVGGQEEGAAQREPLGEAACERLSSGPGPFGPRVCAIHERCGIVILGVWVRYPA